MEDQYFNAVKRVINLLDEKRAGKIEPSEIDKYYKEVIRLEEENKYILVKCKILESENNELREEIKLLKNNLRKLKETQNPKYSKRKYIRKDEETRQREKDYKEFRLKILKRDNYKCVMCGSNFRLQVHHIKPRSRYPELLMDPENCITLCLICHSKTDNFFNG